MVTLTHLAISIQ